MALSRAVRAALLWAIVGLFAVVLWGPLGSLLRGGGLGLVAAILLTLFLISSIRAAASLSAHLWSGRFDREHPATPARRSSASR